MPHRERLLTLNGESGERIAERVLQREAEHELSSHGAKDEDQGIARHQPEFGLLHHGDIIVKAGERANERAEGEHVHLLKTHQHVVDQGQACQRHEEDQGGTDQDQVKPDTVAHAVEKPEHLASAKINMAGRIAPAGPVREEP